MSELKTRTALLLLSFFCIFAAASANMCMWMMGGCPSIYVDTLIHVYGVDRVAGNARQPLSWLPGVMRRLDSQRLHPLQDAPAPYLAPGLSCLSGVRFRLFLRWLRFTDAEGGEGVCMWRRPAGHRGWAAVSGKTHVTTLLWRQEKRPKTSLGQ